MNPSHWGEAKALLLGPGGNNPHSSLFQLLLHHFLSVILSCSAEEKQKVGLRDDIQSKFLEF